MNLGPLSEIERGLNRASVEWVQWFFERERGRRNLVEGIPQGLVNVLDHTR